MNLMRSSIQLLVLVISAFSNFQVAQEEMATGKTRLQAST